MAKKDSRLSCRRPSGRLPGVRSFARHQCGFNGKEATSVAYFLSIFLLDSKRLLIGTALATSSHDNDILGDDKRTGFFGLPIKPSRF